MLTIGKIKFTDYPVFLAPMEDITDPPFRRICKKFGADIVYTEFISSEGLIRDAHKSLQKLDFNDSERPIGIQIFGHDSESMKRAVEIAERSNPDLIDINFGCPVRKVVNKGAGAAMLKNIPLMIKITEAVVKATHLPVTVKTRLGWDENSINIEEVALRLQDTGIKAITIHGRTKKQLYGGKADWTLIGKIKSNPQIYIPVIGNGDIDSPEKAKEMIEKYNVDAIMIGRAIIGNPWIFREIKDYLEHGTKLPPPSVDERINICKQHLESSVEWKGEKRGVFEMRKHYGNYFKGLFNFKQFKIKLVSVERLEEVVEILEEINKTYKP